MSDKDIITLEYKMRSEDVENLKKIQCQVRGCRSLEWTCKDCGRIACTARMLDDNAWYRIEDEVPPPMEDVLLSIGGKVISGWNESVQPEEDPSYCSYQPWPEGYISGEGVTHWRSMPKAPERTP